MPLPFTDSFTDATSSPILLSSHTPTGGTSWALLTGMSGTGYCWGLNGVAFGQSGTSTIYRMTDSPGTADYYARATLIAQTVSGYAGVVVRADAAAKTAYFAWHNSASNIWQLYSWKAGTLSAVLGSYSQTLTAGNSYIVELRVSTSGSNAVLEVKIDGVTRITYTDSTSPITSGGYGGVVLAGNSSGTCYRLDNFRIGALVETSAVVSGTIGGGCNETLVHDTGGSFVITLTGDTWQTTLTDPMKLAILQGLDSNRSDAGGWNARIRDVLAASTVARTSSTEVTITIPATSGYVIPANEIITTTIPASALTGGVDIVATNTTTITDVSAGTITCVATLDTNRVYQRGTSISVSGVYTGSPTSIRVRLVDESSGAGLSSYTTIVASPSGGSWSGSYSVPVANALAKIEASFGNDTSVIGVTSGSALFGYVFGLAGQSNGYYWTHSAASLVAANANIRWAATSWALASAGFLIDPLRQFCNAINDATGIPVAVIPHAVSSTALHVDAAGANPYWGQPSGSLYTTFKSYIDGRSSSRLEGILWIQGEQDALNGTVTREEYATALTALVAQFRSDFANGSGKSNLPIYVLELGRSIGGNNAYYQAIRDAQKDVAAAVADVYISATLMDLPLRDTVHYTDAAFLTVARRIAEQAQEILGVSGAHGQGPTFAGWTRSGVNVDVTLTHRGGTDFTPSSGITGFEFLNNGSPIAITSAVRTNATTIRLTLASTPTGVESLRYLWGAQPTQTAPVLDNQTLVKPLQANGDIASGAAPVKLGSAVIVGQSGGTAAANRLGAGRATITGTAGGQARGELKPRGATVITGISGGAARGFRKTASAEERLCAALVGDVDVSGLIGSRVYPDKRPADAGAAPCVVYQRTDTEIIRNLKGDVLASRVTLQCNAFAATRREAESVANAIAAVMDSTNFELLERSADYIAAAECAVSTLVARVTD